MNSSAFENSSIFSIDIGTNWPDELVKDRVEFSSAFLGLLSKATIILDLIFIILLECLPQHFASALLKWT